MHINCTDINSRFSYIGSHKKRSLKNLMDIESVQKKLNFLGQKDSTVGTVFSLLDSNLT